MLLHILLFIRLASSASISGPWIAPNNVLLPRKADRCAIGAYNNSIFLLGGYPHKKQVVRIDITSDNVNIVDLGNNTNDIQVFGYSQYYSQMNDRLYWIDYYSKSIVIYHLKTNIFESNSPALDIPNYHYYGCLASDKERPFVVGGWGVDGAMKTVEMYDISLSSWLSGVPLMQTGRIWFACVIHPKYDLLYAIGGGNGNHTFFQSIESISTDNIFDNKWEYIQDMSNPWSKSRAVVYSDYILIIGGRRYDRNDGQSITKFSNEMLIIDARSGEVTFGGYLNYKVAHTSAVLLHGTLYAFAGSVPSTIDPSGETNKWQYLSVPTNEPTLSPITQIPTSPPTVEQFIFTSSASSINTTTAVPLCPDEVNPYLNTTYKLQIVPDRCDTDSSVAIIKLFMDSIDTVYQRKNFIVFSTISEGENSEKDIFCSELEFTLIFHVITCFDNETNGNILLNFTKSEEFEQGLTDELIHHNYTDILNFSVENVTIITVHSVTYNHKNMVVISVVSGVLIVICAVAIIYILAYYKRKRVKDQILINNAMVILITVGQFERGSNKADPELENAYLSDLDGGTKQDMLNLYHLFGAENLNYSVYPNEPKMYWTEQEMINLLQKQAKIFDESPQFDALIVIVSSHGKSNNICSSDYQMIEKTAVQQIFTTDYFEARKRPRIFLFDACDGDKEYGGNIKQYDSETSPLASSSTIYTTSVKDTETESQTDSSSEEMGKSFRTSDIPQTEASWPITSKHPDYRLVTINAAGSGFQSKLNSKFGSYMLHEFVSKTLNDLSKNNEQTDKYIHEIFDEIERELQRHKKQHIECKYLDGTRYIRFRKKSDVDCAIEMTVQNQIDL